MRDNDQGLDNKVQNEGSKPDVAKERLGGRSQDEMIQEKGKELDEKMKKNDGSIKYAKPGKSDIMP